MSCGFDCTGFDENSTSTYCTEIAMAMEANCSDYVSVLYHNVANCTSPLAPNAERYVPALFIFIISFFGNISTIVLLSRFKVHKIPDVLVIGLAITDLVAAVIPLPLSLYAYFTGYRFIYGHPLCDLYATVAQFTRYASALIVTVVSVERYVAVIHPFFYRKHCTPRRFAFILVLSWIVAFVIAVAPALDPCTGIVPHEGYCLLDIASDQAIVVIAYGGVQYVIVLFCFIAVSVQLTLVYRRRQKLKVQGKYNRDSRAKDRQHEVKFMKPNLTSRISDLSKSLKKAAPLVVEKFQFGVEAQFAFMLFAVVVVFYLSWTVVLVTMAIALANESGEGLEDALFWGIRISVTSTAVNPILYGVLARQYRLAYWYVIKLAFSKCCRCVSPPLKDVFAAARAPGGDVRTDTPNTRRRRKLRAQNGSVGKASQPDSMWSRSSGAPILTRTTTRTQVTHLGDLEVVNEIDYLYEDSSIIEEHSTFVPSAGELASSVIIPHQARERSSEPDNTRKSTLRATASLDNLVDGLVADFGPSQDLPPGINNPMNNVLSGGSEMSSEQGSQLEDGFQVGRLYSNPVYEIEVARRQRESNTSMMIAASSADDITLVSKVPLQNPPVSSLAMVSNSKGSLTLGPDELRSDATLVARGSENGDIVPNGINGHTLPVDKRLEQMKRLQVRAISRSQEFDIVTAASSHKRNSLDNNAMDNGVLAMRMKFEVTPPPTESPVAKPKTKLRPTGKPGRSNSVGNSDSGRESMVLETDV